MIGIISLGVALWKLGEEIFEGSRSSKSKPRTPKPPKPRIRKKSADEEAPVDPLKWREIEALSEAPLDFAVAILAKFAKADGVVSEAEVACVEEILRDFELTGQKRKRAIRVFNKHKAGPLTYEESLLVFARLAEQADEFRQAVCVLILRLAHADGAPTPPALARVRQACEICGTDYAEVQSFFRHQQSLHQAQQPVSHAAYEALECSPTDSMDVIKARYRHLVKAYHPDTLAGKDVSPELTRVAEAKFREIQSAYETIVAQKSAPQSSGSVGTGPAESDARRSPKSPRRATPSRTTKTRRKPAAREK